MIESRSSLIDSTSSCNFKETWMLLHLVLILIRTDKCSENKMNKIIDKTIGELKAHWSNSKYTNGVLRNRVTK